MLYFLVLFFGVLTFSCGSKDPAKLVEKPGSMNPIAETREPDPIFKNDPVVAGPPSCEPAPAPDANTDLMLALNKARAENGQTQLLTVPHLVCAAKGHAEDIAVRQVCSHTGKDGSPFYERARRCGGEAYGEIIGCGYTTIDSVVNGWLKSPGHRAILLDSKVVAFGGYREGNYWVVEFMR